MACHLASALPYFSVSSSRQLCCCWHLLLSQAPHFFAERHGLCLDIGVGCVLVKPFPVWAVLCCQISSFLAYEYCCDVCDNFRAGLVRCCQGRGGGDLGAVDRWGCCHISRCEFAKAVNHPSLAIHGEESLEDVSSHGDGWASCHKLI